LMKKNFKEVSIINLSKDIITADLGFSWSKKLRELIINFSKKEDTFEQQSQAFLEDEF
jgi:hypothetical protein